jgi:hypothetical protein
MATFNHKERQEEEVITLLVMVGVEGVEEVVKWVVVLHVSGVLQVKQP